jgi:hypothetical protein
MNSTFTRGAVFSAAKAVQLHPNDNKKIARQISMYLMEVPFHQTALLLASRQHTVHHCPLAESVQSGASKG